MVTREQDHDCQSRWLRTSPTCLTMQAQDGELEAEKMQCSMPNLRRSPLLIALSLLAILPGSQAASLISQPNFNTQQTARDAIRILQILNPAGTHLDDAVRNMQQAGFRCQPLSSAAVGYQSSILCTISTPNIPPSASAPPAPVLWTVSLDSQDGTMLDKLQISRTPRDL